VTVLSSYFSFLLENQNQKKKLLFRLGNKTVLKIVRMKKEKPKQAFFISLSSQFSWRLISSDNEFLKIKHGVAGGLKYYIFSQRL